jgi:guanylate kinase
MKKGQLFVLSAPAGTGKTTLVTKLIQERGDIVQSLSYTTRAPRGDETNGRHYNFVTVPEFEQMIKDKKFLEHVKLYGDYYGTCKAWVQEQLAQGKHVILVIDTQGAMQLKGQCEGTFIFIKPPNLQELKRRLLMRRTEPEDVIQKRLKWAEKEMELASKYDYVLINDDIDTAYKTLKSIVIAQEHKN